MLKDADVMYHCMNDISKTVKEKEKVKDVFPAKRTYKSMRTKNRIPQPCRITVEGFLFFRHKKTEAPKIKASGSRRDRI